MSGRSIQGDRGGRTLQTDRRGQTLQDYTLGISVFVLTVAFVFTLVPGIFAPFTAPIDDSTTAQADRVSASLVLTLSADDRANVYDQIETKEFFDNNQTRASLLSYFALRSTTHINVSISDPDTGAIETIGGTNLTGGELIPDGPVAASERIVVIDDSTYQQTVRIW